MDFKGQYLTYDEYRLMGGTLDIMPFNLLETKARTNIDIESQKRLTKAKTIPTEVKSCMYDLIETMAYDGAYKDATTDEKEKLINSIIYKGLVAVVVDGTPLLYRGVI